ncbi:GIP protein, partial [Dyaphorophyia castanea]|nr:GIP protein [Platysteira castanea]
TLRALPLLLACLGAVWMEPNIPGPGPAAPGPSRPLQRRYSEATLASDYSRTMDHVLSKNFVEWLLARRERSASAAEPLQGEAEPPKPEADGEKLGSGARGAKDFLAWLWKNQEKQSFPALEGSEGLREFLEQELVAWLVSSELCR